MIPTRLVNKKCKHDVYIGRPSRWGNPYHIGIDGTREEVITMYEDHVRTSKILMRALPTLAGKVLG